MVKPVPSLTTSRIAKLDGLAVKMLTHLQMMIAPVAGVPAYIAEDGISGEQPCRVSRTMKTKTLKFIITRENDLFTEDMPVVTARVKVGTIMDSEDLVSELKRGIAQWIRKTKEGREAWNNASYDDFNIGDLMGEDFAPILKNCPNIVELIIEVVKVANDWMFDTVLADADEIETGLVPE